MPRLRVLTPVLGLLTAPVTGTAGADEKVVEIKIDPEAVELVGARAAHSLLVHGKTSDGRWVDLTRSANYRLTPERVARVSGAGLVRAAGDGDAVIEVEAARHREQVPVRLRDSATPRVFRFENDIVPAHLHGVSAVPAVIAADAERGMLPVREENARPVQHAPRRPRHAHAQWLAADRRGEG